MNKPLKDIENYEDIQLFVDCFYTKVQEDELLAPIFAMRIPDDQWPRHLNRMYNFWYSVLFGGQTYKGNPFAKHANLPIEAAHFDHWISLFNENLDELFDGPRAEDTKERVKSMGIAFKAKLAFIKANPNYRNIV